MADLTPQNNPVKLQLGEKPPLADHDSSILDLAFAIDVTASMGQYIQAAQQSIRQIVEEIVALEKSDIRLALVEYRDHPPQDQSFVTRTNDFTDSVKTMKGWLDSCSAMGGGDTPEAVADALHDVLKLDWRPEATKICVLISDAPPHGLIGGHGQNMSGGFSFGFGGADAFPEGCPDGLDPVVIINEMAKKNITVYSVGCEPAINPYRDFFMALVHITGGQYVPLTNARALSKVIIGGAQEEITLQKLMDDVHKEVLDEMQARGTKNVNEEELANNVFKKFSSQGIQTKALFGGGVQLASASGFAQNMANTGCNMAAWREEWTTKKASALHGPTGGLSFGGGRGGLFGSAASTPYYRDRPFGSTAPAPLSACRSSAPAPGGGGGLFGTQTSAPPSGGGLFGSTASVPPGGSGLFGSTEPAQSSGFGAPANATTSSGLFGGTTATAWSTTGTAFAGNCFGPAPITNSAPPPAAHSGFAFGSSSSEPTGFSATGFSEVSNISAPLFGLDGGIVGGFGAPAGGFGGTSETTPFSSSTTPTAGLFGATSSDAPNSGFGGGFGYGGSSVNTNTNITNVNPANPEPEQTFSVVDTDITLQQTQRLVKKSLAMNTHSDS